MALARDPSWQPCPRRRSQLWVATRRVQLLSRQLSGGAQEVEARRAPTSLAAALQAADDSLVPRSSPVLTAEHWKSWRERGYMVVKQAVPQANVCRLRDEVYAFLGADPDDANTWYNFEGGMMRGGVGSEERSTENVARMDTTLNMWQTQGQWCACMFSQAFELLLTPSLTLAGTTGSTRQSTEHLSRSGGAKIYGFQSTIWSGNHHSPRTTILAGGSHCSCTVT